MAALSRSCGSGAPRCAQLGALVPLLLIGWAHGLYDPVSHTASARLYGNIDAYAYYYVDLIVGTPPQRVSVILDTGSKVCAFPCAGCRHCGKHIDPAFNFGRSSTASWIRCGPGCNSACKNGKCSYYQGYTEGSSISGFWFTDLVRLGDTIQRNPAVHSRMGCHANENNLFYTQKANGILGIGPTGRGGGARTLLQELFQDHAHISGNIFSMCLAEWGGRLVVGGYNQSYHTGRMQYVGLDTSSGFYRVTLTGMRVNGRVVATRFGSTMIDSGTTYTYMGSASYRQLRNAIQSYCSSHGECGAQRQGKCWAVHGGVAGLRGFPTVDVLFGSVSTPWVPKAYLYRKGTSPLWCLSIEDDGANANTVLGASWMIHKEIVFDLARNRVGIVPANCPEYRERPQHRANARLDPPTAGERAALRPTSPAAIVPTTTISTANTAVPSSPPAAPAAGVDTKGSGGNGKGKTSHEPAVKQAAKQHTLDLVKHDPMRLAGAVVAVLFSVGAAAYCTWRFFCRGREHRHVKLKEVNDSGMPPQIVGSVADTGNRAGPPTFVIGGDDEEDHLSEEYSSHIESRPLPAAPSPGSAMDAGGSDAGDSHGGSYAITSNVEWPHSRLGGGDIGAVAPNFSGAPIGESHATNGGGGAAAHAAGLEAMDGPLD